MKNPLFTLSTGLALVFMSTSSVIAASKTMADSTAAAESGQPAAQDHNSSRSNKTSSSIAPSDSATTSTDHAINTKGTGTAGIADESGGDAAGIAIDEGGTPKPKGKGNATRKAFVVPHVLEKSGSVSAQPCDPNIADCGSAPQDHVISPPGQGGDTREQVEKRAK